MGQHIKANLNFLEWTDDILLAQKTFNVLKVPTKLQCRKGHLVTNPCSGCDQRWLNKNDVNIVVHALQ